jgi:L-threonylcarbamoyladenylate synthase
MERILLYAVDVLKTGGIVAYPTETFYAIGAKFDREESLQRIYRLKQRPQEKAMPLIVGSRELLTMVADAVNRTAEILMERFWPGPLTLILPAKRELSFFLTAGTGKVAVRIPGQSCALHLARAAGFPFTATSANISGMPPALNAKTVIEYFHGGIDLIIDGGSTPGGLPSTIAEVTDESVKVLREGIIKTDLLHV